jgi:hypothetical protein
MAAHAQTLPSTPDAQSKSTRVDTAKPSNESAQGLTVTPGLSMGSMWDSNVFATRDATRSDVLTSIAPYLDLRGRSEAGHFDVEAGGTATRYRT